MFRSMFNRGITNVDARHLAKMIMRSADSAFSVYGQEFLQNLTGFNAIDFYSFEGQYGRIEEMQRRIDNKLMTLKKAGLMITSKGKTNLSEKAADMAAISTIMDEMDILARVGSGDHTVHTYGSHESGYPLSVREYHRGDSYKDLSIRQTIKRVAARGRNDIRKDDLRIFERTKSVSMDIIYILDISGSMHGDKIDAGKKAAVGLSLMGTRVGDRVGVVAFNNEVYRVINPTTQVRSIATEIVKLSPGNGTDIAAAIEESRKMIEEHSASQRGKHFILITDAIPTTGDDDPVTRTFEEVSLTNSQDISISVIGIDLSSEGEDIAKRIVQLSSGRFYHIQNPEELHKIVLEERSRARNQFIEQAAFNTVV